MSSPYSSCEFAGLLVVQVIVALTSVLDAATAEKVGGVVSGGARVVNVMSGLAPRLFVASFYRMEK